MMNQVVLITGCQRSGTTLLNLILDSHPAVTGIDEMHFQPDRMVDYLKHPDLHPCVSFKLPPLAYALGFIRAIPGVKVIWCVRDPRDVVASMIKLPLKMGQGHSVVWANHPLGAENEIKHGLSVFEPSKLAEWQVMIGRFDEIKAVAPLQRTRADAVFLGALCWRLKQALLPLYDQVGIAYQCMSYEQLISHPEHSIRALLTFLDLPWDGRVLMHDQLHKGHSVGGTVNTRPIDPDNKGKWKASLIPEDLSMIQAVCGDIAKLQGYQIGA